MDLIWRLKVLSRIDLLYSLFQLVRIDRLKQIVNRGEFECTERVFMVGCNEDDLETEGSSKDSNKSNPDPFGISISNKRRSMS